MIKESKTHSLAGEQVWVELKRIHEIQTDFDDDWNKMANPLTISASIFHQVPLDEQHKSKGT